MTENLELDKLKNENRQLRAICSIIKTSLMADCRYNTELLERLMTMEETEFDGFDKELGWRLGSRFEVLDSKGEHDPVYVISPNGEMFEFNHTNDYTTDLLRARWIADTLNEAWDKIRQYDKMPR